MSSATDTLNPLYEDVQTIADSGQTPPQMVEALRQLAASVDAHTPELLAPTEWPEGYQVIKLYESDNARVNKVEVRAGAFIPAHNHPNMTALLKLTKGYVTLHIYEPSADQPDHLTNTQNLELRAGDTCFVMPNRNNIHSLTAHEDSVFLDMFTPYYSPERRISFFDLEHDDNDQYKVAQIRQP